MGNLPIEKQVCTLEQAKELAELLGDHAPESLWCWVCGKWGDSNPKWNLTLGKPYNQKTKFYPAYTGDELGVLLLNSAVWRDYPYNYTASNKADSLIQGLKEGWITKEEVKYA